MNRVMLVDDEPGVVKAISRLLRATPCNYDGVTHRLEVEAYTSPLAALERARQAEFALFLVDYRMPEMDGVELLKEIRRLQPNAARIILSGYPDLNGLVAAINEARIYRFLAKPWNDYELVSAVAEALAYRALRVERERLARHAGQGQEPGSPLHSGPTVTWGPDGSAVVDGGYRDPYGDDF